jgi:hypothetical protein
MMVIRLNHHHALARCLSMIAAQTRSAFVSYGKTGFCSAIQVPGMLFRIML